MVAAANTGGAAGHPGTAAATDTAAAGSTADALGPAAAWRWTTALFSETGGRLLVTVPADRADRFAALFAGQACAEVGEVTADGALNVTAGGARVASWSVGELVRAWQTPI